MKIERDFIDTVDLLSLEIDANGAKFNFRLINKNGIEIANFLGTEKNFPISEKTDELISSLIVSLEQDYTTLLFGDEVKSETLNTPKDVGDKIDEDKTTMRKWLGVKDDDFEL